MRSGLKIGGLSMVTIFGAAVFAAIVTFLYYLSEWVENDNLSSVLVPLQRHRIIKTEYSYQGAVLALLAILGGMHGYVVLKKIF